MTTLCLQDLSEPERSNVIDMRAYRAEPNPFTRELAIRDAVIERCKALRLSDLATKDALAAAEAERAFGGSAAKAVAAGVAKAERTAAAMKAIRTRYGTRPDDGGPPRAA